MIYGKIPTCPRNSSAKSFTSARGHIPIMKQAIAVSLWKCLSGLRIITIPVLIIWWAEQIEKKDFKRQDTFVPAFLPPRRPEILSALFPGRFRQFIIKNILLHDP